MKNMLLVLVLVITAGCAAGNPAASGKSVGSQGGAVGRVTVLSNDSQRHILTANQEAWSTQRVSFVVDVGEQLIVETNLPGFYFWTEIKYPSTDIRNLLPNFQIQSGCLSYFGDITIDLRNGNYMLSFKDNREATLTDLKSNYPETFSNNSVCP